MRRQRGFTTKHRKIRLLGAVGAIGWLCAGSLQASAGPTERDPAEIVAWVESRLPEVWQPLVRPVSWHVGDLLRDGAAMEADCSGGEGNGALIGFSTGVYTSRTDEYWQQATAHEYGHVVLCFLLRSDSAAFAEWVAAAGEVWGAPNHVEMFSQCWARLVAGSAPPGYEYDCSDDAAWQAVLQIAGVGPRALPSVPETAGAPMALPDGPRPARRIGNQRPVVLQPGG